MKTINLVPAWYTTQHRRQKNLRLHMIVMLIMGASIIGAKAAGKQQVASIERQRDILAAKVSSLGDPDPELRRRQAELQRLEDLRLARKELGNTIPMSAVIQQLQNDMTTGMALSNVLVDVRSEPVKNSGFVGDPKNPPHYRDIAQLTIVGIAPDNGPIAQFIDKISKNPLFADVTLDYTRTGALQGYAVRKFEIQLSMDLERLTSEDPNQAAPATNAAGPNPAALSLASGGPIHAQ